VGLSVLRGRAGLSPAERQFADQLSIQRLTLPTLQRRRRNYSKFVKFLLNSWNFAGHFGWRPQPVEYPTLSGPAERMSGFGTLTWKLKKFANSIGWPAFAW
jgi:hypothetical protein